MRKTSATIGAAATVCFTALAAAPATAAAPPSVTPLSKAKTATVAEIDARLLWSGISGLTFVKDKNVPLADRNALLPGLAADTTTLKSLRTDVQGATTLVRVYTDYIKVLQLRVYEFVIPQLRTVRDSDDLAAAESALAAKETALQNAITTAAAAHKNVKPAVAALADYKTQLALAGQLSTSAHTAVSLVRGAKGAEAALAQDGVKNFGAVLHVFAAARDAHVISTVTGIKV